MAHHVSFSQFVLSVDGLIAYIGLALCCINCMLVQIKFCGEVIGWVQAILQAANLCVHGSRVKWTCRHRGTGAAAIHVRNPVVL